MNWLLNIVWRCGHLRTSFPMTPKVKTGQPRQSTYIVCLDCGKEFNYNWDLMKVGDAISPKENRRINGNENQTERSVSTA